MTAKKGADPEGPWHSNWCTLLDETTPGWLELNIDSDRVVEGDYGDTVGCGKIDDCFTFDDEQELNCRWTQTTDRPHTCGRFTIRLKNKKGKKFTGTYEKYETNDCKDKKKKGSKDKGTYKGESQPLRGFRRGECCTDCSEFGD